MIWVLHCFIDFICTFLRLTEHTTDVRSALISVEVYLAWFDWFSEIRSCDFCLSQQQESFC